ncbi:Eco57I restriction-modification methylase domain-containing protein [Lactococcus lactis]|uniref:Eco57I restriction-modification methylase domain-containing protein n=1 Tax=Lactococcus lactis TaxID=1358 RepID=UPI003DA8C9BC
MEINNISDLIKLYSKNNVFYESIDYDETSTRIDFINKFFKLFGWDVDNSKGLPHTLREVVHEASVLVEEENKIRNKKPDYKFQINGQPIFFVEAKKPSVNILNELEPAFQIRRYGWSAGMKYGVLTNFKDLVIYDCSVKPEEQDAPSVARILSYNYHEYPDKMEELDKFLSKENALNSTFEIKGSVEKTSFDNYFLKQIKTWRLSLANDVYNRNIGIDEETLNLFVQKFINKSLFLRICEDKSLEEYEQLASIKDYQSLKSLFEIADKRYNSGLFHLIESQDIEIGITVFSNIYKDLYYPRSSYDFSVIPSSLLAKVYDIFLSEKLIIEDSEIVASLKAESKDFLGAVSTPKELTDLIAAESIEKRLSNSEVRIEKLKIADICCGSGMFLISAYEYILRRVTEVASKDIEKSLEEGILIRSQNELHLSFKVKKSILENCIYGVDIDPSAVEVCKFSLLLSCIEGITLEEFHQLKQVGRILPNLDNNILFGNSLVDNKFYEYISDKDAEVQDQLIEEVVPFDLINDLQRGEKFDVILGNPPYIRVQKMNKFSPIEYAYYKSTVSGFELNSINALDKYYLFIEKAIELLKINEGVCGYIIPNRFMHDKDGQYLRDYLSRKEILSKIINYNEVQVFSGVQVYVCILVLDMSKKEELEYSSITLKKDIPLSEQFGFVQKIQKKELGKTPWLLFDSKLSEWSSKVDESFIKLKECADIFVGIQTSKDDIYFIQGNSMENGIVSFKDSSGKTWNIERKILKESLKDSRLRKYSKIKTNSFLIYPYELNNGVMELISLNNLKINYPLAYKYLESNKKVLKGRKFQGKIDLDLEWHRYGRSQSISKFENGEQLVWSVLTLHSNFVYTPNPVLFSGGGNGPYYGLRKINTMVDYSLLYIQAILNSPFISDYIEQSSVYFRGGYFTTGKQYIENIPIKKLNLDDKNELELYKSIVTLVEKLNTIGCRIDYCSSSIQNTKLKRQFSATEDSLNKILKKLYEVGD